ncbi:MAG: hypothetical protein U0N15_03625 [Bifidobacterium choerinum]
MKQTYTKHGFHEGMHIGRLTLLTYHRGGSQHHRSTERGWFSCRCDCGRPALDAVKQLDLNGVSPIEALMIAWTDGWNSALDLCIQLEQQLDPPDTMQLPTFSDGGDE